MTLPKITELRIKRRTLAEEARIIRGYERKALAAARAANATNHADRAIIQYARYDSLRQHRIGVVRNAARLNHLAHAYLKGTPYAKVEDPKRIRNPLADLDRKVIAKTVEKFGGATELNVTYHSIELWMKGFPTLRQKAEAVAAEAKATAAE